MRKPIINNLSKLLEYEEDESDSNFDQDEGTPKKPMTKLERRRMQNRKSALKCRLKKEATLVTL